MAFSDYVVYQAWMRAGGKCECRRLAHAHLYGSCNKELVWENREAHHVNSNGDDTLSNCEILCWDCHKKTLSFGAH